MRRSWTIEEDEALCKYCVENYVKHKSNESLENFISQCSKRTEFSERGEGAIRMRIQNIKAILDRKGIQNTIPLKPLANNSKQTENILLPSLIEQIIKNKNMESKDVRKKLE